MQTSSSGDLPQINRYLALLEEHNQYFNLISRKVTHSQLDQLLGETECVAQLVSGTKIVDAGSGNGLLGIPIAIRYSEREIILLESKEKKADFLMRAAKTLNLQNVTVVNGRLEDFVFSSSLNNTTLVARGFPSIEALVGVLVNRGIKEIVIVTSLQKIENLKIPLEKVRSTIYNIPSRDVIKILKMENVSRETN